jgi:hypothetical protein
MKLQSEEKLPGDVVANNLGTPVSNNGNGNSMASSAGGSSSPPSSTGGDMKSNVSSFIPADVGNTLSQIQNPSSFGQQLTNQTKQQVIGVVDSVIQRLRTEIENTIGAKIKLEVDHAKAILDISSKSTPTFAYNESGTQVLVPSIYSSEEAAANIVKENDSYNIQKVIIDNNLKTLNDRLQKIILDPYLKIKKDIAKAKLSKGDLKTRIKALKSQMDKQKLQQLTLNIAKGIVVTTSSLITLQLIKVISDNSALQDLVDKTNNIIDAATTIDELNQARIARNGCISNINQQEARIQAAIKILNVISVILIVFNILNTILSILNIPSPLGVAAKPLAILNVNAGKILDSISAAVGILIPILNGAVFVLEDLKRQLHDVNSNLEEKTLALLNDVELFDYLNQIKYSSNDPTSDINRRPNETDAEYADRLRNSTSLLNLLEQQNPNADSNTLQDLLNNSNLNTLSGLANQITPTDANNLGTYKGFTFFTKEENNPKFTVKGNKRHYVVAIDTKNVERLKSDYSFTLNPQQLVSQLKFIIDQQNLQG